MRHRYWAGLLSLWLAGTALPLAADTARPVMRIPLLELYTSEGCNSCPPADRWVSALPRPQLVPERLVVLSFHVDYWNYLGWPDRFSQRLFTERQQALVRRNNLRTAYTPQLVLNGRDFRATGNLERELVRLNATPPGAELDLKAKTDAATVALAVKARLIGPNTQPATLYIALYENNLVTEVKAGENRGERLRHDYVVRALLGPFAMTPGKPVAHTQQLTLHKDWNRRELGVAAFVQADHNGETLQAVARPL